MTRGSRNDGLMTKMEAVEKIPLSTTQRGKGVSLDVATVVLESLPELLRLERDVFPGLGEVSVATITPPMLLEVLRRIEARGVVETAHRALENCSQIFRYGIPSAKQQRIPHTA